MEDRQTKIKDLLLEMARKQQIKVDSKQKFNGKVDFAHKYIYECMLKYKENKVFFEKYKNFYKLSTKQKDYPLYVNMKKSFQV